MAKLKRNIYLVFYTLRSLLLRGFINCIDIRSIKRSILHKPVFNVVFVANMRDYTDKKRFLGSYSPPYGHFSAQRFYFHDITGVTRPINVVQEELMTEEGRKKAQRLFVKATQWANVKGANVVLLAAGTKRLFGKSGAALKDLFPNMIFTLGDNGTTLVLLRETLRALKLSCLYPNSTRIAVLGPYGFLGETIVNFLIKEGYKNIIGAGPRIEALKIISEKYNIDMCENFTSMGKVDAVIACTHSGKIRLTAEAINVIRHHNKKLLVVDVSEPSNFRRREYLKCKDVVIRQDAGNAYSKHLKYFLGALAYKMARLTKGVTFGCFAEALSIAMCLNNNKELRYIDWFSINEKNMQIVADLFEEVGFDIPSPRCFGEPVKSFELDI